MNKLLTIYKLLCSLLSPALPIHLCQIFNVFIASMPVLTATKHPHRANTHTHLHEEDIPHRVAPIESELKFHVPTAIAQNIISSLVQDQKKPPVYIEQHVLNPKRLQSLLRGYAVADAVSNPEVFSSARARRIVQSGKESFVLEFKSPKQHDRVSRFEFGVPIDEARFKSLTREHSIGCLRKLRHVVPGTVNTPSGNQHVGIELDQVLDAGNPAQPLSEPFFTADIEGTKPILEAVARGLHSFDWLKKCSVLSFADQGLRKTLSNKKLACQGFGIAQVRAVEALTAL